MSHAERDLRFPRVFRAAAAAVAVLTFAAGAGYDSGFEHGDNVDKFVTNALQHHKLRKCIGKLTLKKDGHVRTDPTYLEDGSLGRGGTNAIDIQHSAFERIVVEDPMLIVNLDGETDDISKNWYIAEFGEHRTVFINEAAIARGRLDCSAVATPQDLPGPVSAQPITR